MSSPEDSRQQPTDPAHYPGSPQYQGYGYVQNFGPLPPVPPPPPVPEDLNTARVLWRCEVILGLIGFGLTLAIVASNRKTYARQMLADLQRSAPEAKLTLSQVEIYVWVALGLAVVIGLVFSAAVLLVVHLLRRGRMWARVVLTAVGAFLIMSAIVTLFSAGVARGALGMAMDGVSIVQAVVAGGAIYLMHRPEVNVYLQQRRR